jgi:predicted TIM-barrel fold metal-dependent hydrolase
MPETMLLNSSKLREFIDVGAIPDHLKEKAWEMLERRVKAFGFDGWLGHHPANSYQNRGRPSANRCTHVWELSR